MKPHLEKAHSFWQNHLRPTDHVIDATCGNGKDTAILSNLVPQGHVYAIDIQKVALEKAREHATANNITFLHQCHSQLPKDEKVRLIVYNLGYLPGGNKELTSKTGTTLQSVQQALHLLPVGGALSITCYPGHPEGAIEEQALQSWSKTIAGLIAGQAEWFSWKSGSPTLLTIIK